MARPRASALTDFPSRPAGLASLSLSAWLTACGSSGSPPPPPDPGPPARVMPAGRLVQNALRGPITHTTAEGWRTHIEGGTVTIQAPAAGGIAPLEYSTRRMQEQLGTHDLRAWEGERRTLLLPGGAKLTLHGQAGEILRASLYDGAESHEIDVLTQTLMHSRVDAAVATARDAAEADGEAAALRMFWAPATYYTAVPWLHLTNLYAEPAGADGTPQGRQAVVQALGRLHGVDLHTVLPRTAPPAEADESCSASEPQGRLVKLDAGPIDYTTASGLWSIKIDAHTITLTRSGLFTWQVWGDPHENLNGKHTKDWNAVRRTLLLDDGTKVTMHSEGPHGVVHTTSIYDGAQSHEIGNTGNMVRHSCVSAEVAASRDAAEADGETALLAILKGPAMLLGYLYVENVYTEPDGDEEIEFGTEPLGETGDADTNPNQVNDYYDDPRLGHT
jgi:hypothetical protein